MGRAGKYQSLWQLDSYWFTEKSFSASVWRKLKVQLDSKFRCESKELNRGKWLIQVWIAYFFNGRELLTYIGEDRER